MNIRGLNKFSLLDYPGKLACLIFTGNCNFRCPFCQNASLVLHPETERLIEEAEVMEFLKKRVGILEGVCITGGEPTMIKDLPLFIEKVKALGFLVKLDTNGNHPIMLKYLVENKLIDYVAMDIKNAKDKYSLSVGIMNFNIKYVEESISFLLSHIVPYEFRTTVVAEHHTLYDFEKIGQWIKGARAYYLQVFQDSGDLISQGLHAYSKDDMVRVKEKLEKYVNKVEIRGL